MKANTLGYGNENSVVRQHRGVESVGVQIVSDATTGTQAFWKVKSTPEVRSNMLCCVLSVLLIGAGVGIGVWYALVSE